MFRLVMTSPSIPGRLYVHSMPGRFENLATSLAEIADLAIELVFSLAPAEEVAEKSPDYAKLIRADNLNWGFSIYPIPDYGTPEDPQAFLEFIKDIAIKLKIGQNLLLHCGAGIGRTGVAVIAVLLDLGHSLPESVEIARQCGAHPETEEQQHWIEWFANLYYDSKG